MRGLAIYTIVVFGALIIGLFNDFSIYMIIGMVALSPILIFAIIYLAKSKKKAYCGNCGAKQ